MNKQELAAKIWDAANGMRSKIEANEYKDYILGFIFYKFLSEKEEEFLLRSGMPREDFSTLLVEDNEEVLDYVRGAIGYFISYDHLYSTWLAKGTDFNVSDVRDALRSFSRLISPNHMGVFEGIFETLNTGLSKLGDSAASQTTAISDLLAPIGDIPMGANQGYDVLGFIYEYLIAKFAANAGKKAGEFYTPHEVSILMSQIIARYLADRREIQIYDPTSGSGSLLLNIGQAVGRGMGDSNRIKYYAQELKANTYNLTRMNLVMRGIRPDNIVTRNADTLEQDWPLFDPADPVGTYTPLYVDAVVSNPPYSQRWDPTGKKNDARYADFGLAPDTKADYAFLLHDLFHVKPDGLMTIVLPHGVLFRSHSEATIRQNLIERNHIDTIIGLPANIFFGTGIPTIIMVLKQRRDTDDVLFIDASQGFQKVGTNNQLRASDIRRIVDAVTRRTNIERFARVVTRNEIRDNDYNLNLPRYVSATPPAEPVDLYATMFGGAPESEIDELAAYWNVLPGLREALFEPTEDGYAQVVDDVHERIDTHPSVSAFRARVPQALSGFEENLHQSLIEYRSTVKVLPTEEALTADVFTRFAQVPLVDAYDAYQIFHDQWAVIATDLEMIQTESEDVIRTIEPVMVAKTKNKQKVEVQDGWQGRIIPFDLVQSRLLGDQKAKADALAADITASGDELTQLLEDRSEEEKVDLAGVLNAAGDKFAKTELNKSVKDLLKQRKIWPDDSPEAIQIRAKRLLDNQAAAKKQHKTAVAALETATYEAIKNLSNSEVDQLLAAKWIEPLMAELNTMPSTVLRRLDQKVTALRTKYASNLVDLDSEIRQSERDFDEMLGSLTGSQTDLAGITALRGLLEGPHE